MTDNSGATNFINLCLHPQKLRSKKEALANVGRITKELALNEVTISPTEFVQAMNDGQTWTGAIFDPQIKKAIHWTKQQVFAIDVDSKVKVMNPDDLISHFKGLNMPPNVIYHSLSSKPEKPKYRLVWFTAHMVDNPAVAINFKRWLINNSLDQADTCTINLDRLYFGGTNGQLLCEDRVNNNYIPQDFPTKEGLGENQVFLSEKIEDLNYYLFARARVKYCIAYPHNEDTYGSRHQNIFKGAIFLVKASNGVRSNEQIFKDIKDWQTRNPEFWEDYDRSDDEIMKWIAKARVWAIANVFQGDEDG